MNTATVSSSCFLSPFLEYPNHSKPKISKSNQKTIKSEIEIRVCVNKACSKQGSRETLEILSGISPPNIIIKSSGCLSKCGSGPNLVVLPQGVLVSHVGTPMKTAQVLACFTTGKENDPKNNLKSLALRKKADVELDNKNYEQALTLLDQAYICQGDAFLEMEEFDAAEKSYSSALQTDPSIRRSKSFKARVAMLHEKLAATDLP